MATDVSSFKNAYKTAITTDFPRTAEIVLGDQRFPLEAVDISLRYGTNPHQPFAAYRPVDGTLSVGRLEMLKGGKAGLSLTNLQDMSQALNVLKYFEGRAACVAMKHLNPCGFKVEQNSTDPTPTVTLYEDAKRCDPRSHFGAVVGFNTIVGEETAEAIMSSFVECVIAPSYSDGALAILKRNEGTPKLNNAIRIAKVSNLEKLPRFVGDNIAGLYNIRNLADGTLTFEVPYLTRIRTSADFIADPMIPAGGKLLTDIVATTVPTAQQLEDALTSWYLNINVRSNGVVFVKNGMAISVGTGQQERIGAVEQAIAKAKQKGHCLRGAVMSSDAFFPNRDCIDAAAAEGIKAIVWPAGSMADAEIIKAANEHRVSLLATLERCFLHI